MYDINVERERLMSSTDAVTIRICDWYVSETLDQIRRDECVVKLEPRSMRVPYTPFHWREITNEMAALQRVMTLPTRSIPVERP
jgi:hypothetical protein